MESEALFSPIHAGFRPGLSTLTQITSAQAHIIHNINQRHCVDGVYTDLSEAFDTIFYTKLLFKLHAYDIQGSLLSWIKYFLTGRV